MLLGHCQELNTKQYHSGLSYLWNNLKLFYVVGIIGINDGFILTILLLENCS
jgi:hypothetical protein